VSNLQEACESRERSLPCSGLIQTLPATSSLDASGNDLMYSFSLTSSSTDAYGKAALNMPVALMYPSLDRLCSYVSAKIFHPFSRASPYHQEVCLWVFPVRSLDEDSARAQIARKRHAQVRIVEDTKVIRLRRVRGADLTGLHLQFSLAKTSALDKDLIYHARIVSESSGDSERIEGSDVRLGARSSASIGFLSSGRTRSAAIVNYVVARLSWYGMRVWCCNVLR
jgi:hypothetical protein